MSSTTDGRPDDRETDFVIIPGWSVSTTMGSPTTAAAVVSADRPVLPQHCGISSVDGRPTFRRLSTSRMHRSNSAFVQVPVVEQQVDDGPPGRPALSRDVLCIQRRVNGRVGGGDRLTPTTAAVAAEEADSLLFSLSATLRTAVCWFAGHRLLSTSRMHRRSSDSVSWR